MGVAEDTARKVTATLLKFQEDGVTSNVLPHFVRSMGNNMVRVSWAGAGTVDPLAAVPSGSMAEYVHALRNQQFSAVLGDGAILQVSFDFARDELVAHRLLYCPSPFEFTEEELGEFGHEQLISACTAEELLSRVRTRPYLRFDYANESSGEPSSHCHTALEDCRIPVCSPLSFSQFIEFVFENFYPKLWASTPILHGMPIAHLAYVLETKYLAKLHFNVHRSIVAGTVA
jgi:hypothetical protein